MIRDLLTAEAQRDPYVWAAVLVAHAGIGVALWVLTGSLVAVGGIYAGFELVQALTSRRALIWDSLLDWSAVSLGAVLGWALEVGQRPIQMGAIASVAVVAVAGVAVRRAKL